MENQIPPTISTTPALSQTPDSPTTNWLKILLFILLELGVIVGSVFVGIQIVKKQLTTSNQQTNQSVPNQTQEIVTQNLPESPTTQANTDIERNYVAGGASIYSKYQITILPGWRISHTVEPQQGYPYSDDLILTYLENPKYLLSIRQGDFSGGVCRYNETLQEPEPGFDYTNYVELRDKNKRRYRRSNEGTNTYNVCTQDDLSGTPEFYSPSIYGQIIYRVDESDINYQKPLLGNDQEIIKQMDTMLSSIEKYGY